MDMRRLPKSDAREVPVLLPEPPPRRAAQLDPSAWLLAALSGVLHTLIFPAPNLTFLCWVALAPLLLALLRARRWEGDWLPATAGQGFLLGYVSGLIWAAGSCFWVYHTMHVYGGLSVPVAAGILVLFCLALAAFIGLFGALLCFAAARRLGRRAVLLAPALWVALELLRTYLADFPWDPLGNVLVDNIPLSRLATVTGVHGLSFEIMLVNTAFAAVFLAEREKRRLLLVASVVAAVVLQAAGLVQPPKVPAPGTARLVQSDVPILPASGWTAEYYQRTLQELAALSVPRPGELPPNEPAPDVIVWPESPAPFFLTDKRFLEVVGQVARAASASVISGSLGMVRENDPNSPLYNSAVLIAPSGRMMDRYDKIHLVPFGEYIPFQSLLSFAHKLTREVGDFAPGSERKVLDLGASKVSVLICYESVFPNEVRQFAARGAQWFVNISNDGWFGETGAPEQHLRMARMRAVENHRWLLLATNTGITASVDPYGRVVARAPRNLRTVLDAPYGVATGTTFYTRHGDWFAYACAIISVVVLLLRLRAGFRATGIG